MADERFYISNGSKIKFVNAYYWDLLTSDAEQKKRWYLSDKNGKKIPETPPAEVQKAMKAKKSITKKTAKK